MSDPFNSVAGAGSDPWQNLMAFGLATMATGAQPGARTLGALGQGGLAAMQQSKENALAAGQANYYGAETQAKNLANQVGLTQINFQRSLMGQPPLDAHGMPTAQQQSLQMPSSSSSASADMPPASNDSTPINTAGMPYAPTAGSSARPPQSFTQPSSMPTPPNAAYSHNDIQSLLGGIYSGQIQPTPEIARIVGPTASAMNLPIAPKLLELAYNPTIAGATKQAEAPYEYHDVRDGGALFQGNTPVAYGGINAIGPDGTPYMIPPRAASGAPYGQGALNGDTSGVPVTNAPTADNSQMPLGIRNNNPTNMRPTGDKWQGQVADNQGYMTFKSPEDGIRAATINLQNYQQRGWNTPLLIAEHWVPAGDGVNNPQEYGMQLAKSLGVDPGQQIDLSKPEVASAVIHGLTLNENGVVPYHPAQIYSGVNAALGSGSTTQAGQSAASNVNSAIPAGAIQTGISPSQKSQLEARSTDLGKKQGEWDEQAQGAISNNFLLDQMKVDAQTWRMGKWADTEADARKYLQGFATLMGADTTRFDKPLGDYQAFQKSAGQLTREAVRETSSKAAFQEFQLIQNQLPSSEMSQGGFDTITNQMQAVNDYKIARQTAAQAWMQDPSHKTLDGFEVDFNKNVTPATFLFQRTAQNNPAEFKEMWSNMQKTPQGQKVLQNLIERRNYAMQSGLFE